MISLDDFATLDINSSDIYIDAHCHLTDLADPLLQELVADKSIKILPVNSAYSYDTSLGALEVSKKYGPFPNVIGLSPHKAQEIALENESIKQEIHLKWKTLFKQNKGHINGIGEIGLDFHWGETKLQKKRQMIAFEMMIEFAQELKKPIVIHSRDSILEVISTLESHNAKRVMFHFFSGGPLEAKRIVGNGWFTSIPPLHSKKRKKSIREVTISHIFSETDSPYIGKTPNDVIKSVEYISETLHLDKANVRSAILRNALTFFNIRTYIETLKIEGKQN